MRKITIFLAFFALMSCANNQTKNTEEQTADTVSEKCCASKKAEKCASSEVAKTDTLVEVYYFHGAKRCATCIAVGELSELLIDSLNDANIKMVEVDMSTEEGEKIADEFEVAFSSLILKKGEKKEDLTQMSFAYAKNQPEVFKANLLEKLKSF